MLKSAFPQEVSAPCGSSIHGTGVFQLISGDVSIWHRRAWMTLVGTAIGLAISHTAAQAASFSGLGLLSGATASTAAGVSADGSVVVGSSGNQAFRWTAAGGIQGLGFLPGGTSSTATAVSADGSVVVGGSYAPYSPYDFHLQAFRWTATGGMQGLGSLLDSRANGVSDHGSLVVGEYLPPTFFSQAIIWPQGGSPGAIAYPTYLSSAAKGVSADGSVVVGYVEKAGFSIMEAFRWTQAGGLEVLGFLPGNSHSSASSVSADGSVVVGQSGSEAFLWNSSQGMQGLGFLPGSSASSASGLSADGSVVVGQSGGEAFLWNSTEGMQSLAQVLIAAGVTNLTGWGLANATAVSADGYTVVGYGTNPNGQGEAWIADLRNTTAVPTPALLPGLIGMGLAAWRQRRQESSSEIRP